MLSAMGSPVVTILAVQVVTNCWGFSVSPRLAISSPLHSRVRSAAWGGLGDGDGLVNGRTIRRRSQLFASRSVPPLPSTDDPFELLGLDPRNPTTDAKEIKRAYRKRAMQYHPDVLTGPDSTEKERDEASKNFARINGAYEFLTGGNKSSNASSSTSSSSSSSSGAYSTYNKPPHRRQSNASSGSYRSTNWEDYMPNYDDEDAKYDADGDSFGAIFSDVLTGAAGYASGVVGGGGGIVGDFIEFLENMDGFQSGGFDDDKTLRDLIAFGSYDEVSSEMDECDILVSSLEKKLSTVENELIQAQADLNAATRYSERLDIDERIAELKAREKVVKGYVKKTKKRLISLRERYKEMVVEGRGGRGYGSSASSRSNQSSYSDSAYKPPQPSYSPPGASPTPSSSSSSSSSSSRGSTSSNNWRNEGFSGSRRSSRSRSSRRGREREAESTSSQRQRQSSSGPSRSGGYSTSRSSNRSSSSSGSDSARSTPQNYEPYVPPHRRSQSSTESAAQQKKRLRELEVDDEFDKLKREMGL